ncbi:hypothetical protein [Acidimangrovimonas sediminis]|uniref:hypothetical protein n=1 Tax=Acidimangrovimonas sediminis TaxID=2056283 RepID=UPI000C8092C5|nr:hypothetical protein [Acidimangrovimonas sediminis]
MSDETKKRLVELRSKTGEALQKLAENPDLAKGTIGGLVLDMLRSGEEVSRGTIVRELEVMALGLSNRPGANDVLAKGALKVIFDLPS